MGTSKLEIAIDLPRQVAEKKYLLKMPMQRVATKFEAFTRSFLIISRIGKFEAVSSYSNMPRIHRVIPNLELRRWSEAKEFKRECCLAAHGCVRGISQHSEL